MNENLWPQPQTFNPPNFLSASPLTVALGPVDFDVGAESVLFACFPISNVFAAVGPVHGARALALVLDELALVATPVGPQ